MKQGRSIIAILLIFLLLYILIKLSDQQSLQQNNAIAYPGPSPEPTLSLAYPGPETQSPTTLTPVATPFINWELVQPIAYLPVLYRDWKPLYFSIAGADQANDPMTEAIPENLLISPYRWAGPAIRNNGTYWYPGNQIQFFHTCLAQRMKYWSNGKVIFKETYGEWNEGDIFCWDPMTEHFARIVRETCQDPVPAGEMCAHLETSGVEQQMMTLIQQHPEWIWVVGNEPDNGLQDALHGTLYMLDKNGDPQPWYTPTYAKYAAFYAHAYALVRNALVGTSYGPRLVFCQSTWAFARGNAGLTYCENAFNALPDALIAKGVTNITAPDTIYALATHEYLQECYFIEIPNQPLTRYCDSWLLTEGVIEYAVPQVWIAHLQEFEEWAQTTPGLENKPLWLTEFGSWKAWCPEIHPANIAGVPGVPCTATGKDHVFYGRYPTEGIWGLQLLQVEYLAHVDNNWQAVWWYVSRDEKGSDSLCAVTAWVWGANDDCELNRYDLSRAGETYRQAIECKVNHINCPPDYP